MNDIHIIGTFQQSVSAEFKPPPIPPIGELKFILGGKAFKFEPQRDMTGYEITKIWQLAINCPNSWPNQQAEVLEAVLDYMRAHGIERHFVMEE